MPWDAKSFVSKHNHKLTGKAADTAARQATAMVREGVPEGIAIATANKTGNRMEGQHAASYARGGAVIASSKSYAKGGEVEDAVWKPHPGFPHVPPADTDADTDHDRSANEKEA